MATKGLTALTPETDCIQTFLLFVTAAVFPIDNSFWYNGVLEEYLRCLRHLFGDVLLFQPILFSFPVGDMEQRNPQHGRQKNIQIYLKCLVYFDQQYN
jgi:hypothetical protein